MRVLDAGPAPGPFLVLGMGRSGTSYLASLLHHGGIPVGDRFAAPDEHNPRGYYEDLRVTRLHAGWLAEDGFDILSLSDRFPLPATRVRRDAVRAYVQARSAAGRPWGLKGCGLPLVWPTWLDVLPPSTVLLLPFRHPDAVARSMVAAGLRRDFALASWRQLNRLSLEAIDRSGLPHLVLPFDRPGSFVEALTPLVPGVQDRFEPALFHHAPGAGPLDAETAGLYQTLLDRAASSIGGEASAAGFDWYPSAVRFAELAHARLALIDRQQALIEEQERLIASQRALLEGTGITAA